MAMFHVSHCRGQHHSVPGQIAVSRSVKVGAVHTSKHTEQPVNAAARSRPIETLRFDPAPVAVSTSHEHCPSQGWYPSETHLSEQELWQKIRQEARSAAAAEPALASFFHSSVLMHASFARSIAFICANKLHHASCQMSPIMMTQCFITAFASDPDMVAACSADLQAVVERDPACETYIQPMLFFKGFQALQCHRVAHWLWHNGRKLSAKALHARVCERLHVDIHPAARIGRGVMIDHATGVVIGETAIVGDNVSMLHHVSLGGSGRDRVGVRHPSIGHGVLLGAGVNVVGAVSVGAGSKVGARSVVLTNVPSHAVAVGVPAKVIKRDKLLEPIEDMDQVAGYVYDFQI